MEDKAYKITLADGTVIDNLELNGNNFISKTPIDPSLFAYNCSPVIISDGKNEEFHENMEFIQTKGTSDGFWFVLRDIPQSELARIKMQSDIEYIAMMSGVVL